MEQFKQSIKDITKYTEGLEKQVTILKKAINDLLNEDDIKDLPCYELIKMTYSDFGKLSGGSSSSATVTTSPMDLMYAPPHMRYKKQPQIKPKSKESEQQTNETTTAEESTYSSHMPDMDICQLGGPGPGPTTKPSPVKVNARPRTVSVDSKTKAKSNVEVYPKKTDMINRVEIKGETYIMHDVYLYDIGTKNRIGKITDDKIVMDNNYIIPMGNEQPTIELEQLVDFPEYYVNGENLYRLVNNSIAQAIGTYNDGDIALWS